MAAFVSLNGMVVPGLKSGAEGVRQKSAWVLWLNIVYLVALLLVWPYNAKSFIMLDSGVTMFFILAALTNSFAAQGSGVGGVEVDQAWVWFLVVVSWGFIGGMAFWFRSRRLLKHLNLKTMSTKEVR